jgi:hypothetical protein
MAGARGCAPAASELSRLLRFRPARGIFPCRDGTLDLPRFRIVRTRVCYDHPDSLLLQRVAVPRDQSGSDSGFDRVGFPWGIRAMSVVQNVSLTWENFGSVVETQDHIVVRYRRSRDGLVLPKRDLDPSQRIPCYRSLMSSVGPLLTR